MNAHRFARIRRFRFNLPQRIAACLLAAFLLQGLWLTGRQTLTDRDYQYARCGREMWERPSQLAGYFTSCGNIHDGILAYRLAGLPLTLNLLAERGLDRFRQPEDRVVQSAGVTRLADAQVPSSVNLMPVPANLQMGTGQLVVDPSFSVGISGDRDPLLQRAVDRFLNDLRRQTGMLPLDMKVGDSPKRHWLSAPTTSTRRAGAGRR